MPEAAVASRAPVGTHDVLPPESSRWAALVATFAARADRFGYGLLITPLLEHVEVFQRVGASTDVVREEMYELTDRGGRTLALRPEAPPGGARLRAASPHPTVEGVVPRPPLPLRTATAGPLPPALASRQAEVLGVEDPDVDVGDRPRRRLLP